MCVQSQFDLSNKPNENFQKESEDHFKLLVEGIKDYAIFMLDTRGNLTTWNEGARRMKGYEEKEILGKHFSILYTPEDIKKNKPAIELQKARENGTYEDEGWRVKKNGALFWANIHINAVYKEDGALRGFAKITRDITKQKKIQDENKLLNEKLQEKVKALEKSEAQLIAARQQMENNAEQLKKTRDELEKVFTYSADMICSLDSEGRFMHLSKAAEAILGYKPEELVGKKIIELVPDKDIEKSEKARQKIKSGTAVTNFENNYYRKDGSVVCIAWSAHWSPKEETMFCVARDATEQKNLEKAFKNEQERFADLFLQAPVNICFLKGENHVFEMANPLYLETFSRNNIIGKTVKQAFPEVEEQGFLKLLDNVYRTGKSFSGNEILVKVDRNGNGKISDIYINFIYQAHRNSEGEIEGVFFFGINVTEQVKARKKTEESEQKYSDLIQNLPAAIYTSDAEGRIMLYNKAAANLWGGEPAVGKDFWCKDCKTYKANGTLLPFNTSPMALTLMEKRPILGEEIIIESSKGFSTHVLPYSTPVYDFYGNLTGAVNMLIDITDRKKAEEELQISNERFETVIKATNDAIWEWNLVTGDVYHNTSYERIFGYPVSIAAQNIQQWIEKIHPEDRDRVRNSIMQKRTNADTGNWQSEYRYTKANGEVADVYDRGFIIVDDQNKPIRFVGAMQDITERKKTEIEKEYLIEQLTQSYRDLQQFTYITSHNLRAPLSNLIGLINNTDYNSLNDFNKNILEMFRTSTQQLLQTINDLNQILIIKNNAKLEIQKINIEEVFNNVCKYFIDDIEKLPVFIHTNFECEEIPFNKSYLESVLTNLISNSIKYRSPARKLELNVMSKREKKGYVSLTFTDNGMGIDLERNKDKIFGLYQRFHSNASGTGFGLFITKTQITSFGGTVEVQSEVDKGTTFYIRFREKVKYRED